MSSFGIKLEQSGSGGGAPVNASYIVQTPNATLTNEQALSSLATGLMQVTTTTGVVSSVTTSAGVAALISDETGTGALVFSDSPALTGNPTAPTQNPFDNSTNIATTAYVENAVLGQNFKEATKYATVAALPSVTYSNGASGVGATLTASANGALSVDGNAPDNGDRILVKNQVTTLQNGIYSVTDKGSAGTVFILTRTTDFDMSADINTGDSNFVTDGAVLAETTWAYNGDNSPTLGTDPITYAQVAGSGIVTGGNGITVTGSSVAIDTAITIDTTTVQSMSNKTLTSPTINSGNLVTPTLGVATATSINGLTIDTTTGTLDLVNGSTLATSGANSITLTSTGATNVTLPTTGTLVTLTGSETLTNKRVTQRVVSMTDGTSFTPTADTADMNTQANTQAVGTLTANAPSGTPTDGQKLIIRIKSTNVQTFSWNAIYRGSSSLALPTTSTGTSKTDYFGFIYNSADTKWDCMATSFGY